MLVVILIVLSLAVAGFIMLSDTRKNDNFKRLERGSDGSLDAGPTDASDGGDGGDGGGD